MSFQKSLKSLALSILLLFSFALHAASPADAIWIDVRTPEELKESSIPNHLNILHTEIGDKIAAVTTDKNAPIFLYCRSGRRSGIAKETLEQMGYTNVTNAGGIEDVRKQLAE
jgi:phage shock protein E